MTVPDPSRPAPATADGPGPPICSVCPHRQADHDAIANRFCSAKIAGGSGRGCVCRPAS